MDINTLTEKDKQAIAKYLKSDTFKRMDNEWKNRSAYRLSSYNDCLDLQVRNDVNYWNVTPVN